MVIKRLVLAAVCLACASCLILSIPFFRSQPAMAGTQREFPTVVLDAGHGGIDGGAVAVDGTSEKDINLAITLKTEAFLRAFGVPTVMVRTDDRSIHDESAQTTRQIKVSDIHNRMKLFEETPNSVLVSIHQNHYSSSSVRGAQVFYSKNTQSSADLAEQIQDVIRTQLQPWNDRKIKPSGSSIYLLYQAKATAVLVECGFISNPEENAQLHDEEYQGRMAFCIAQGILQYVHGGYAADVTEGSDGTES